MVVRENTKCEQWREQMDGKTQIKCRDRARQMSEEMTQIKCGQESKWTVRKWNEGNGTIDNGMDTLKVSVKPVSQFNSKRLTNARAQYKLGHSACSATSDLSNKWRLLNRLPGYSRIESRRTPSCVTTGYGYELGLRARNL
ncbi:hypothetical protein EVAR_60332_1 [Eumeta japonica]|uniref:Uncharacterized protein n=1 Tax=Eumeta variegata TaxID=151549 RepID=A0A4C1Z919_EUMVA|nr:hypothetical protein EVAR_60332_1 [Eumeta japonica]